MEALVTQWAAINSGSGNIRRQLHGAFHAPLRIFDSAHALWFNRLAICAGDLSMPLTWRDSGEACEGNRLSAAGLPTIDTLGPVRDGIHSSAEHIELASLFRACETHSIAVAETGTRRVLSFKRPV